MFCIVRIFGFESVFSENRGVLWSLALQAGLVQRVQSSGGHAGTCPLVPFAASFCIEIYFEPKHPTFTGNLKAGPLEEGVKASGLESPDPYLR
eukprot:2139313-Amphidinium_carterae.1